MGRVERESAVVHERSDDSELAEFWGRILGRLRRLKVVAKRGNVDDIRMRRNLGDDFDLSSEDRLVRAVDFGGLQQYEHGGRVNQNR